MKMRMKVMVQPHLFSPDVQDIILRPTGEKLGHVRTMGVVFEAYSADGTLLGIKSSGREAVDLIVSSQKLS